MRNDNYPSASEVVRNLAQIRVAWELLCEAGKFRIIRFESPFFNGSEYWVVNEKGFLWEPVASQEDGLAYLETDEARDYNESVE